MSEESTVKQTETKQAPPRPRLKDMYVNELRGQLCERLGLSNAMAAPRLEKIVLNMGVGRARQDQKLLEEALLVLQTVAGQKPVVTKARRSVAGFQIRDGDPVGCRVTLRGAKMWEFLDRLVSIVLPRIRDFQGLSPNSFDGHGNYSMGIREHIVFPEADADATSGVYGMDVTICTTADSDPEAVELLRLLGLPFRK